MIIKILKNTVLLLCLVVIGPKVLRANNCANFAAFLNERGIILEAKEIQKLNSFLESTPKAEVEKMFERLDVESGLVPGQINTATIIPAYNEQSILRRVWTTFSDAFMRFGLDTNVTRVKLSSEEKLDIVMVFLKSDMPTLFKRAYEGKEPLSLAEKRALILSVERAWFRAAELRDQRSLVSQGISNASSYLKALFSLRNKKINPAYNPEQSVTVEEAFRSVGGLINEKSSSLSFREEDIDFQKYLKNNYFKYGFWTKTQAARNFLSMIQVDGSSAISIVHAAIKTIDTQIIETPKGFAKAELQHRRKVLVETQKALETIFGDKESIAKFTEFLNDGRNQPMRSWLVDNFYYYSLGAKKKTRDSIDRNLRSPYFVAFVASMLVFFKMDVIPNAALNEFEKLEGGNVITNGASLDATSKNDALIKELNAEKDKITQQYIDQVIGDQEYAQKIQDLKSRYPDDVLKVVFE